MKIRLLPLFITIIASSVLLFGGWLIYHNVAIESPLNKIVLGTPGVQKVQTDITANQVSLDLTLNNTADLRNLFSQITTGGASVIGNRNLTLNLESNTSPELEQWWSSALFDVAQAMDTKHYSSIPEVLTARATQVAGLKVETAMDNTNVYVKLTNGEHSKYIILPRNSQSIGVWPNEQVQ